MIRISCLALVPVFLLVTSASAQVKLERKYADNAKYTTAVDSKLQQVFLGNQTSSEQHMVTTSEIGKRDASGNIVISYKIDSLQAQVKSPLGNISFDSVNPDKDANEQITPIFKASANSKWKTTIGKDGRVVSVTGRDDAFEKLDPTIAAAMKGVFEPEYLKEVANKEITRIPETPIKVGDSWEQTETVRLDSLQSLTFKKKYTYAGTTTADGKTVDKIDVATLDVKLSILDNPQVKLNKAELKVADSKGALLFDRAKGRIISDKQEVKIQGSVVIQANGMDLSSELDLTMDVSIVERP